MARIVIAEDEKDIRNLVVFTLKNLAGHEVFAAKNGEEAVEKVREERPDLILLDVRMPKMTGYEACEKIKNDESLKDIPVVFLSAKGQDNEIQTGLGLGAIKYILKPFSPDKLTAEVKQILEQTS
ncbi:MAG: two-component system response regulator [Chloroflexota bacterium]|nr:MAG: two-component system response regulator [Anaerolineaceae bacterium 4572_5.2]RLD10372.1 MAG: two-component system response regulator [Chloroflexota bacterium]